MSIAIPPNAQSWVDVPPNSDFPIQNLPFGIFETDSSSPRVGVAIGEHILDVAALGELNYLEGLPFELTDLYASSLNRLMSRGKKAVMALRQRLFELLEAQHSPLQHRPEHIENVLATQTEAKMLLPVCIGDYTDFYASKEHAMNVGSMFRDPENALLPNWLHLPVGYHGRSSSIVVSNTAVRRPSGQQLPKADEPPIYGPSRLLDFELEMAFVTFDGKPLGERISTDEAEDYIFGLCLFNDWSARDIQKWEYVPLGPFLGKNFASSISPWIVPLEALDPFRIPGPVQEPEVLPYLQYSGNNHLDIQLQVILQTQDGTETVISQSNAKHLYWNMHQQLAHHTVNGCNIRCGDMMASGTISGPSKEMYGSLLELSWKGTQPLTLNDGSQRTFLQDGDTIIMRGHGQSDALRIGFGEVRTSLLPAL